MINPFDLPGPIFLLFYALLGAVIKIFTDYFMARAGTGSSSKRAALSDPYEIAYLRGGKNEALKIAALSLVDRDLLTAKDTDLSTPGTVAQEFARRPIELAILQKFRVRKEAKSLFDDAVAEKACSEYERALAQAKLISSPAVLAKRLPILTVAVVILLGVAVWKIILAIERGHSNVWFLIILWFVLSFLLLKSYNRRRTIEGDRVLADLRTLFERLKDKAKDIRPGGTTNEAALLAAIFGIGALPKGGFFYAEKLFPKTATPDASDWSFDGGDSSGCGSSCGSSCGGGGCGGGCGGCGS